MSVIIFSLSASAPPPHSPDGKQPRRDDSVVMRRCVFLRHQIARNLLHDKLIVRYVAIERVDDPVTVTPRLANVARAADAASIAQIRVAGDVEPVLPPALAVTRRSQQSIDNFANASGESSVRNTDGDFLGRRRKPSQSNVRRINVRLSASGTGASPFSSSFASTKRSISFAAHAAFFTSGRSGFLSG